VLGGTLPTMPLRCGILVAIVALTLLAGPGAGAAEQSVSARVAKPCGTLRFNGSPYGVQGRGVGCRFMRVWTRRYQLHGLHPRGWSCVGRGPYTDGGSCQDRHSRDYFEYYIED
jgi:hypothetical protein